jgi:KDO2-lipid IV(A) lauroyltransferase
MVLVGRLARKTGAAVIFSFAERLPGSAGFRAHWVEAPEGIDDPDPVRAASALNLGVERCVRRCPEQYQWSYKRFQARPEGEPEVYRGPR